MSTIQMDMIPPTDEECRIFENIRESCSKEIQALDYPDDDVIGNYRLCRFYRANNQNVKDTKNRFREFLKIRIQHDHYVERIREEIVSLPLERFLEYMQVYIHPKLPVCFYSGSKDSLPSMIIKMSAIPPTADMGFDSDELFHHYLLKVHVATMEWHFRYLNDLSHRQGSLISFVSVMDLIDFKGIMMMIKNRSLFQFRKMWRKEYQDCYDGHDALIIVCNMGPLARAFTKIASIMMTKTQNEKLMYLGSLSKPDNQDRLYEYVDKKAFPKEYGGCNYGGTGPLINSLHLYGQLSEKDVEKYNKERLEYALQVYSKGDKRLPICASHIVKKISSINITSEMDLLKDEVGE